MKEKDKTKPTKDTSASNVSGGQPSYESNGNFSVFILGFIAVVLCVSFIWAVVKTTTLEKKVKEKAKYFEKLLKKQTEEMNSHLVKIEASLQYIENRYRQLPSGGQQRGEQQRGEQQKPEQPAVVVGSIDDDPMEGSENAKITLIEFSDFQCPFCARFYKETLPLLRKEYISTGKVRHVFRDFPLGFHAQAQKAAEAAECANEQGKFWIMYTKIFGNQTAITVPDLKKYAQELGLNTVQFNSCLDSGKYYKEVQKDVQNGSQVGVSGTPSFIIGKTSRGKTFTGKIITGAQPFQVFKSEIDKLIRK